VLWRRDIFSDFDVMELEEALECIGYVFIFTSSMFILWHIFALDLQTSKTFKIPDLNTCILPSNSMLHKNSNCEQSCGVFQVKSEYEIIEPEIKAKTCDEENVCRLFETVNL
jgi:hypothetical protein